MRVLLAILSALLFANVAAGQKTISFPTEDGGMVSANLYGSGDRAVLLVHGGRFTKESWAAQAPILVAAGFEVLAIDLRGPDPPDAQLALDVLAAVRYLHKSGAKTVSIVGGSMGGAAAGDASITSRPGEIDRIVMLGAAPNLPADKLKSPALFIVARDDANDDGLRLPGIQAQYEKTPQPKKLVVLEGSAHAQYLFQTDQSQRVMDEILRWLSAK